MGEAMHVWGKEGIRAISIPSFQFCSEAKIALKINSLKNHVLKDYLMIWIYSCYTVQWKSKYNTFTV